MDKMLHLLGHRIEITDVGSGSDTLLFIHGNSASKEFFKSQFNDPLLRKYRLIGLDLLGHGGSDNSSNSYQEYTVEYFAKLVIETIKNLHIENCIVVGWSLGGHIAIEAVEQGAVIKALVLTGTPPIYPKSEDMLSVFLPIERFFLKPCICN